MRILRPSLAFLCAFLCAACSSQSSVPPTFGYLHPKAYAWYQANKQDVRSVISNEQLIWGYMQTCTVTAEQAICPANAPLSPNPMNWPVRTPEDCASFASAVTTVQADGPIPNGQAQGWWSTALQDFQGACSAIGTAMSAADVSLQNGTTGYDSAQMVPGGQAVADMTAGSALLNRVGVLVNRKGWSSKPTS